MKCCEENLFHTWLDVKAEDVIDEWKIETANKLNEIFFRQSEKFKAVEKQQFSDPQHVLAKTYFVSDSKRNCKQENEDCKCWNRKISEAKCGLRVVRLNKRWWTNRISSSLVKELKKSFSSISKHRKIPARKRANRVRWICFVLFKAPKIAFYVFIERIHRL